MDRTRDARALPVRIGAHCSVAGGIHLALARAAEMGCRSTQIFTSSPRRWRSSPQSAQAIDQWHDARRTHSVGPVFAHGSYLINLAAEQQRIYAASVDALSTGLGHCDTLGLEGLIFHPGSHQGRGLPSVLPQLVDGLTMALEGSNSRAALVLENSAGAANVIGSDLKDLGTIIDSMAGHQRLRICLDSAHAFAAGFDLRRPEEVDHLVDTVRTTVGLDRLAALHVNDSLAPLGSKRDRHANLGEGEIGLIGLENFLTHPAFAGLPAMLETPGFGGGGPDVHNVNIALSLVGQGLCTARGALEQARTHHVDSRQPNKQSGSKQ